MTKSDYQPIDPFREYRVAELQIRLARAQEKIRAQRKTILHQGEMIQHMIEGGATIAATR